METWLLRTVALYMSTAAQFPVILSKLLIHSPILSLFECNFSYIYATTDHHCRRMTIIADCRYERSTHYYD